MIQSIQRSFRAFVLGLPRTAAAAAIPPGGASARPRSARVHFRNLIFFFAFLGLGAAGCGSCQGTGPGTPPPCQDAMTCAAGAVRVCVNQCKPVAARGEACEPDYCSAGGAICAEEEPDPANPGQMRRVALACAPGPDGRAICQDGSGSCNPDQAPGPGNLCQGGTFCKRITPDAPAPLHGLTGICAAWTHEGQACDGEYSDARVFPPTRAIAAPCEPGTRCAAEGNAHVCRRTCDASAPQRSCPCGDFACVAEDSLHVCRACARNGLACAADTPCCEEGIDGTACTNGTCCRGPGNACRDAVDCCSGSTCGADHTCVACGGAGQACCGGNTCGGGLACSGNQCVACGGAGQPCCGGNTCGGGLACNGTQCVACGGAGQACCGGNTCGGGLACNGTQCVACGGAGQVCCANGGCAAGTACSGGHCSVCGGQGQPCCGGGSCGGGLACLNGTCGQPPCGGAQQACCAGDACGTGFRCASSAFGGRTCQQCGHDDEMCCLDQFGNQACPYTSWPGGQTGTSAVCCPRRNMPPGSPGVCTGISASGSCPSP